MLKIKLLPNLHQAKLLLSTIKEANASCNNISEVAWKERVFNQIKLHHQCYYNIKDAFNLSSQMIVRCISKVADAYKSGKKVIRHFRDTGAISYDSRILTYKPGMIASIWTIEGRKQIPFICHNLNHLPYVSGEARLVYRKGKFFLFQTCDVPEESVRTTEEFIGCDFGITDIVVTSDGKKHSAKWLKEYREQKQRIRSSIQRKGTRSSKRLLKRLSGREKTTATIQNHTVSKSIVHAALESGKGISLEDLTHIRTTTRKPRSKRLRISMGRWNFGQLRFFIEYKARLKGIPVIVIDPAYTSKTCSVCYHIGNRNGKSFKCKNCGSGMDADMNASKNIATLGAVYISQPESSIMCCSLRHFN